MDVICDWLSYSESTDTASESEVAENVCKCPSCPAREKIGITLGIQTLKISTKDKRLQARPFTISTESNTDPCEMPSKKSAALPILDFNDQQVVAYTGVNKSIHQFLLHRLGSNLCDSRNLCREYKLALVLVKLKMNTSWLVLSSMFGISQYTIKNM